MQPITLNGVWKLSFKSPDTGKSGSIPARVPGNVLGDLHRAGLIPDPFYSDNSVALRRWEFVDWNYETTFATPEVSPGNRVELVCDGIDTVAEIFINGQSTGTAASMFVPHRFDITALLKAPGASNTLEIAIRSNVNAARDFEIEPFADSQCYNREALVLRRANHTYGWDIAPRLVGGGLWRGVRLEISPPERWTTVHLVTMACDKKQADLALFWEFKTPSRDLTGFSAKLTMVCGEQTFELKFPLYFVNGKNVFSLPEPKLWFPVNCDGGQPLYHLTLELCRDGAVIDTFTTRVGIRSIDLERTETIDPTTGGKFQFTVNGRRVFVLGTNWVPATALHGENEPELVRRGLALVSELGCNLVRGWGGGVYEDDAFFDYCDEHGILVWQDFMVACETPPQDDAFMARLRSESIDIVKKLRHHPSLALWSGDNEGDERLFYDTSTNRKSPPSANRVTREVLADIVRRFDPMRDYLPSSPCISDESWQRNLRYNSPEQHLWGPRDNHKSDFYRNTPAIFASEIGYHGMPALASVKKFIPPEQLDGRDEKSPAWLCHAAQPFGDFNGPYAYRVRLMVDQVREFFGEVPADLADFVAASQIVQAEALKFFIENFRFSAWEKTGIIWWNAIDCWPQFSDAVVDFYGTRKLAFYYVKAAQRPVLLGFREPDAWQIELAAANALDREFSGTWRVTELEDGTELASGTCNVPPNTAATLGKIKLNASRRRFICVEWRGNDGLSGTNAYLLGHAAFDCAAYRAALVELDRRIYRKP